MGALREAAGPGEWRGILMAEGGRIWLGARENHGVAVGLVREWAGVACRVVQRCGEREGDAWKRWKLRPLRPSDPSGAISAQRAGGMDPRGLACDMLLIRDVVELQEKPCPPMSRNPSNAVSSLGYRDTTI